MVRSINKTTMARLSVGIIASGLNLILLGCGDKEPAATEPVARPIKIVTIGGSEGGTREYPGTIEPVQHADMAFEVSGKIIELPVNEGQEVKKGEVLARLDPRDFQANLDAEVANRNAAKADYERMRDLYERDAVSKQELDVARRNYEVAASKVKTTKKAVEDSYLRAPFAGKIAKKLVNDFQNVRAKDPVLILQDESSLKVVINIPERDAVLANPDLSLEQKNARVKPRVVLTALPDKQYPAAIFEYSTAADPITRTFEVSLAFTNPPDINISPGMTARVIGSIPKHARRSGGISLPATAVTADKQGKAFVWRVDPKTMKVSAVPVVTGELRGDEIDIRSGLQQGDLIAVSGVHQLREDMLVRQFK